jgi:hypothetical protein
VGAKDERASEVKLTRKQKRNLRRFAYMIEHEMKRALGFHDAYARPKKRAALRRSVDELKAHRMRRN